MNVGIQALDKWLFTTTLRRTQACITGNDLNIHLFLI